MPSAQNRQVRDGNAGAHGPAARLARDRHQAAEALRDLVEAGPVGVGAVLAETGNARIDQARVDLAERGVVDAETLFYVRPIVLDHDVGRGGEPAKNLDALWRFQVEPDGPLVAVQVLKIRAVPGAAEPFAGLQVRGQLHLDDVGPPVRELTSRGGTGAHAGEVEHGEAGKRTGRSRSRHEGSLAD